MKNFKKVLALVLAMMMIFTLAACGGGDADNGSAAGEGGDVVTYKVGMEPTFPPFDTTDDKGDLAGFDVDLMNAIAEDQGFKVEFENLSFGGLVTALQTGQIDIIASGMNGDDEERRAAVDFSIPYYRSGLVVAVAADNTTINSVDDLTPDMKVAAQQGTTGMDTANDLAAEGKIKEAVILDGVDTAMMQLTNGDVQAVINDLPVTNAYIEKQPDDIKIVGDVMNAERYAIAVQKGNADLLEKINTGLLNIKESGKFAELYEKWFDSAPTEADLAVIAADAE